MLNIINIINPNRMLKEDLAEDTDKDNKILDKSWIENNGN